MPLLHLRFCCCPSAPWCSSFFFTIQMFTSKFFAYIMCSCLILIVKSVCSQKYNCCICGKFTLPEFLAQALSSMIVALWIITGHWILMDSKFSLQCCNFQKQFLVDYLYFSNWDWFLHHIYSDCATTEPQSVDSLTRWSGYLRRVLGLLFAFNF